MITDFLSASCANFSARVNFLARVKLAACIDIARLAVLSLALSVLAACGGGGGDPGRVGPPLPVPPVPAFSITLTEVASGLSSPVFLTSPPNDSRRFIVERGGRIRILQSDGIVLAQPFLDLGRFISTGGEGGLLSMAFHPRFADNGLFFVYYTDIEGNIVVERFSVSPNPNLADPTSGLAIIVIPHPFHLNHFGGLVSFGPDGFLYLGTGDGGGFGDPGRNAQSLNSLLGKILRLDVDASTRERPFAIPASNPFAGQAGRRGEIWAFGLRNPWRFTFDDNVLFIADVGQDRREEVNVVNLSRSGVNFGWNIMEGNLCFLDVLNCDLTGLTRPVFDFDHGANKVNGCSITGGFVYRGRAIPELAGRYFFSDFCRGFLKSFLVDGSRISEETDWRIRDIGGIVSFGRDADGELYLLTSDGRVFRIDRAPAAAS